jgi:two-component system NtrC family sensor kinase
MLQHSRSSSGVKELTDINALCDEYLRLSYHGLRAKDKSFNSKFETNFNSSLPKIDVVPQDIGRVVLNLINNAFYAVSEQRATNNLPTGQAGEQRDPLVIVSTKISETKLKSELLTTAMVFLNILSIKYSSLFLLPTRPGKVRV